MAYPQTEEEREQIKRNFEKHQAGCINADCVCRLGAPQDTQWEVEFDKHWYEEPCWGGSETSFRSLEEHSKVCDAIDVVDRSKIKAFISSLLTSQRERLATAVEGLDYDKYIETKDWRGSDGEHGFNEALKEAAELIRHSPLQ